MKFYLKNGRLIPESAQDTTAVVLPAKPV